MLLQTSEGWQAVRERDLRQKILQVDQRQGVAWDQVHSSFEYAGTWIQEWVPKGVGEAKKGVVNLFEKVADSTQGSRVAVQEWADKAAHDVGGAAEVGGKAVKEWAGHAAHDIHHFAEGLGKVFADGAGKTLQGAVWGRIVGRIRPKL